MGSTSEACAYCGELVGVTNEGTQDLTRAALQARMADHMSQFPCSRIAALEAKVARLTAVAVRAGDQRLEYRCEVTTGPRLREALRGQTSCPHCLAQIDLAEAFAACLAAGDLPTEGR